MNSDLWEIAEKQAEICKTLGNPRRLLILWALNERELCVHEIAEAIDASIQNSSQHLRLMKDRGILSSHRKGRTVYYRISDHAADELSWLPQLDQE